MSKPIIKSNAHDDFAPVVGEERGTLTNICDRLEATRTVSAKILEMMRETNDRLDGSGVADADVQPMKEPVGLLFAMEELLDDIGYIVDGLDMQARRTRSLMG